VDQETGVARRSAWTGHKPPLRRVVRKSQSYWSRVGASRSPDLPSVDDLRRPSLPLLLKPGPYRTHAPLTVARPVLEPALRLAASSHTPSPGPGPGPGPGGTRTGRDIGINRKINATESFELVDAADLVRRE